MMAGGALLILGAGTGAYVLASVNGRHHRLDAGYAPSAHSTASSPPASEPPSSTVPPGASSLHGFLANLSNAVIFIQWTQTDNAVNGTAQAVYLNSNGTATTPQREAVQGTIQGSNLSLNITPDGLYGVSNLTGTLQGSGFVVSIPNSQGILIPVTFSAGTVADYDTDLAALEGQATQASNVQAQAQARQQAAAALASQERQAQQDASTVANDISGLHGDVQALSSDVSSTKQDLAAEGGDLKTVQQDAAAVESEAKQYPGGNSGQVCSDAATAASDADTVASDADTVESDALSFENDVSTVTSDISGLKGDWNQYLSALPPGYDVTSAPTRADVINAINAANSADATATSDENQLIQDANAEATSAFNIANQASLAGNCGSSGSPPTPNTTIPPQSG
jgi:hypothetical protein